MAKQRPMKIEDLFKLRGVGKVAMSPCGDHVAFELKRFDLKENKNFCQIMLADVESGETRPLTQGEHTDSNPRWSPDGSRLAFVSSRDKGGTLWCLPMDGGQPTRLTDPDGWVSDFSWSPDGRFIAYAYQSMNEREKLERDEKKDELKQRPSIKHITRLTHKLDGAGFWNGEYTHIWVMRADGGGKKQLTRGAFNHSEPRFSPAGRLVSLIANRGDDPDRNFDQSDIFVVPRAGGALRQITRGPGHRQSHAWSPDGKLIAFIGNPCKPTEWWKHDEHIFVVDAKGGKPRDLAPNVDLLCMNATAGDVASSGFVTHPPLWSADSRSVLFNASEDGCGRMFAIGLRDKQPRRVIGGDVNIYHASQSAPGGPIALAMGSAILPGDVFVASADDDYKPRQLTHVNRDALKRVAVVQPEKFSVRSDNVTVQGWVIKPPGFRANRLYPAILQIHGGPQSHYGAGFFHEMQMLAGRGYVVVFSNPRGGTSYGLNFRKCIFRDWGNLDYKDIRKVGDWIFRQRYVDSKRVGVTGGSYGGFMTNWMIAREHRYKAAVTQRSVVSMASMFGVSDYGFAIAGEFNGLPWKGQRTLEKFSPLSYVEKIQTPLLIIHSEEDLRCPVAEADQLFTALKYLKREVEYVRFEGESHGLSRGGRPQNRAERLRRIAGWFDRYLK
ncbi:MAG: S9 family peptidase [Phycisphaerales bacterium]|nr:S9 family peptidase [Phycisphaerales bacterium]